MSNFGTAVVEAARTRMGEAFRHHFKPEDLCAGGSITVDACMERGMDPDGYDCSGLVIASVCDVFGMSRRTWPRNYRHVKQLEPLTVQTRPRVGDALLFDTASETGTRHRTHIGIYAARNCVVHANGLSGIVEEGQVQGTIVAIRVVPSTVLEELEALTR